jgi:hypothetical protein
MMSSMLEDLGTNRTDEETVFKNFHIDAWAVLTQVCVQHCILFVVQVVLRRYVLADALYQEKHLSVPSLE